MFCVFKKLTTKLFWFHQCLVVSRNMLMKKRKDTLKTLCVSRTRVFQNPCSSRSSWRTPEEKKSGCFFWLAPEKNPKKTLLFFRAVLKHTGSWKKTQRVCLEQHHKKGSSVFQKKNKKNTRTRRRKEASHFESKAKQHSLTRPKNPKNPKKPQSGSSFGVLGVLGVLRVSEWEALLVLLLCSRILTKEKTRWVLVQRKEGFSKDSLCLKRCVSEPVCFRTAASFLKQEERFFYLFSCFKKGSRCVSEEFQAEAFFYLFSSRSFQF